MPEEDDECPHGLGMKTSCVLCNGRAAREAKLHALGDLFPASYKGFCRHCEEWFDEGAMIGRVSSGEYVCAGCWVEVAE